MVLRTPQSSTSPHRPPGTPEPWPCRHVGCGGTHRPRRDASQTAMGGRSNHWRSGTTPIDVPGRTGIQGEYDHAPLMATFTCSLTAVYVAPTAVKTATSFKRGWTSQVDVRKSNETASAAPTRMPTSTSVQCSRYQTIVLIALVRSSYQGVCSHSQLPSRRKPTTANHAIRRSTTAGPLLVPGPGSVAAACDKKDIASEHVSSLVQPGDVAPPLFAAPLGHRHRAGLAASALKRACSVCNVRLPPRRFSEVASTLRVRGSEAKHETSCESEATIPHRGSGGPGRSDEHVR